MPPPPPDPPRPSPSLALVEPSPSLPSVELVEAVLAELELDELLLRDTALVCADRLVAA
jgi:hypothetical protein